MDHLYLVVFLIMDETLGLEPIMRSKDLCIESYFNMKLKRRTGT